MIDESRNTTPDSVKNISIGGICISKGIQCAYAKQDGYCALGKESSGKQTLADKIRHMTDEELAKFMYWPCDICIYCDDADCNDKECEQGVLAGLREEV